MSELKVIDISEGIKTMCAKVNSNFSALLSDIDVNSKSIAKINDNYYVANLLRGLVNVKNSVINGAMYITFGSDKINLKDGRLKVISAHSVDDIATERGMIYTLSESNSVVDLTIPEVLQNIDENEFITIRISDTDAIYGFVKVSLVGYQNDRYMELSPEHPSITLQKVHNSGIARFMLMAYPDVTDIETSEGDIIYYILEKVLALERAMITVNERLSNLETIYWRKV